MLVSSLDVSSGAAGRVACKEIVGVSRRKLECLVSWLSYLLNIQCAQRFKRGHESRDEYPSRQAVDGGRTG